jgi:succinate-semialdehyde dehydrogenase/glutarate-semialdehyde dehydrogenase
MIFKSVNPKNGKLMKTVECISNQVLQDKVVKSFNVYKFMRNEGSQGFDNRMEKFERVKAQLQSKKQSLAELITNEMGKPLRESIGEVDKSISMIDFYN